MAATMTLTATEHDFSHYLQTRRPWFTLFNVRLRPAGTQQKQVQLAPIQQILPEEILADILHLLPPYTLAKAACVCTQWAAIANRDSMWQEACYTAFQMEGREEILRHLRLQYRGRWRAMFLNRPHLRFDGIYVSRNTYIRTGIVEWRVKNPVHLVCYYRYLRFFPHGEFAYRTTPQTVAAVASTLEKLPRERARGGSSTSAGGAEPVLQGRYRMLGTKLACELAYPNMVGTRIRTLLELRSTVPAANNRLDLLSIKSYDQGVSTPLSLDHGQEEADGGLNHSRGKSTYVFVPWESVADSPLNLPVSAMDFYVPG